MLNGLLTVKWMHLLLEMYNDLHIGKPKKYRGSLDAAGLLEILFPILIVNAKFAQMIFCMPLLFAKSHYMYTINQGLLCIFIGFS